MSDDLQSSILLKFNSFVKEVPINEIALGEFLNNSNISDVAFIIQEEPDYISQVIPLLSIKRASKVFKIIDIHLQKLIIEAIPAAKSAELLNELSPDDRINFLKDLPKPTIRELLKLLTPEERKITLSLLDYPESSVGRLMTPDYIYTYPYNTAEEVLNKIRSGAKNSETIDVIYVISNDGELIDDFTIRDLILAEPHKTVQECLMDGRIITLNANEDQEIAYNAFKMNNRVALPVVDDQKKLLGIVTVDDILWVAKEEFSEDMQKIGATEVLDEPYLTIPLLKLFKKRISWLVFLFLGEMLTATAMGYFEKEISRAVVLSLFLPLIMSSGGNSGSQASTLIIQSMAIGEVKLVDWWLVFRKEIISGFLLGSVLACLAFMRIGIWHFVLPGVYGIHWLIIACAVSSAVVGVVMWGTICGAMLPIVLKKLGADPAVSSAPFVATLVDVTGIIIYFTIAYQFLYGIFFS